MGAVPLPVTGVAPGDDAGTGPTRGRTTGPEGAGATEPWGMGDGAVARVLGCPPQANETSAKPIRLEADPCLERDDGIHSWYHIHSWHPRIPGKSLVCDK